MNLFHYSNYKCIVTGNRKNGDEFIRSTVMIFQEDFDKFFEALEKVKANI